LDLSGNIEDEISVLKQQGVQFRLAVSQDNVGSPYFEDPDGNFIYMIQLNRGTSPSGAHPTN
jgi:hypothetical protein